MNNFTKHLLLLTMAFSIFAGCRDPKPKLIPPKRIKKGARLRASAATATGEAAPPPLSANMPETPRHRWLQFRGPNGHSIGDKEATPPTQWSPGKKIYWTSELPGRGSSSPIVFDNRVFVTATTSPDDAQSEVGLSHHIICLSCSTGGIFWRAEVPVRNATAGDESDHSYASTPVTDGEYVYAFFGNSGLFAFDLSGKLMWSKSVGELSEIPGSDASLSIQEDLLLVNASRESHSIYALDKKMGRGVWRLSGVKNNASMPIVGKSPEGEVELVVANQGTIQGIDLATGEQLWHCNGPGPDCQTTLVVSDGICYVNGGRTDESSRDAPGKLMAIRLGGKGHVSDTNLLWSVDCNAAGVMPIYVAGTLFVIEDQNSLGIYDASNGKRLGKVKVPTEKPVLASPLLIGNSIYIPTQDSGVFVCEANADAAAISTNKVSEDAVPLEAPIVPIGRQLLMRTDKMLYCIGGSLDNPFEMKLDHYRKDTPQLGLESPALIGVLSPSVSTQRNAVAAPFESVLTPEQTKTIEKLVIATESELSDLRSQYADAVWSALESGSSPSEVWTRFWGSVESQVKKMRAEVKAGLTEEQLAKLAGNVEPVEENAADSPLEAETNGKIEAESGEEADEDVDERGD